MATVLATLVTYTEEAAPISTGMPTNAAQAAGMVRIPPPPMRSIRIVSGFNGVTVAIDIFCNIIPCPQVNGSFTKTFCCSEQAGTGCCDTAIVNLDEYPILTGPGRLYGGNTVSTVSLSQFTKTSNIATAWTSKKLPPISPSVVASTTSASVLSAVAKPLTHHSPPTKKLTDLSVAIGVPLGVFAISGLIALLIHERRLRIKAQKTVVDTLAAYEKCRAAKPRAAVYEVQGHPRPQELEHTQSQPGELYDGEIHELK